MVSYNNSLTWIKAIWGWFPLLTMIPGFGRSEVVMKFTQINAARCTLFVEKKPSSVAFFVLVSPADWNEVSQLSAINFTTWLKHNWSHAVQGHIEKKHAIKIHKASPATNHPGTIYTPKNQGIPSWCCSFLNHLIISDDVVRAKPLKPNNRPIAGTSER